MSPGGGGVRTVNTASPQVEEMLCAPGWSGHLQDGRLSRLVAACTASVSPQGAFAVGRGRPGFGQPSNSKREGFITQGRDSVVSFETGRPVSSPFPQGQGRGEHPSNSGDCRKSSCSVDGPGCLPVLSSQIHDRCCPP